MGLRQVIRRFRFGRSIKAAPEDDTQPIQFHLFARNPFDQLPLDILVYLQSFLDPISRASLALTTRALYQHARIPLLFGPDNRRALMHLLERDFPELLFCRGCRRLYRWRKRTWTANYAHWCVQSWHQNVTFCDGEDWYKTSPAARERRNDPYTGKLNPIVDTFFGTPLAALVGQRSPREHTPYSVTPEIRDLILRYERHRDLGFGLPIQVLDHSCQPIKHLRSPSWQPFAPIDLKIAACVFGSSLLLRCERRYDIVYPESRKQWAIKICQVEPAFCRHQRVFLPRYIECIMSHGEASSATCQSMIHCNTCRTDWLITFGPADGDDRHFRQAGFLHNLWLTGWHNCGTRGESSVNAGSPSTLPITWPNRYNPPANRDSALGRQIALAFRSTYRSPKTSLSAELSTPSAGLDMTDDSLIETSPVISQDGHQGSERRSIEFAPQVEQNLDRWRSKLVAASHSVLQEGIPVSSTELGNQNYPPCKML